MSMTFLYARVSTVEQTLDHQLTQAQKAGFKIDRTFADHGVSGVSTRLEERPEGKRLLDVLRPGDQVICRWVDRLGRDYKDVTATIRDLMERGVIVRTVINNMTFDGATSDPMQMAVRDAMIAFMAATAQAQAEVTKSAQKAGIAHAKARPTAYRGRKPAFTTEHVENVIALKAAGAKPAHIAKELGIARSTVYNIMADPAAAQAIVHRWA